MGMKKFVYFRVLNDNDDAELYYIKRISRERLFIWDFSSCSLWHTRDMCAQMCAYMVSLWLMETF